MKNEKIVTVFKDLRDGDIFSFYDIEGKYMLIRNEDGEKLLNLVAYCVEDIEPRDWEKEVLHFKNSKLIVKL